MMLRYNSIRYQRTNDPVRPRRRLVVLAGLHKTGTTAIQQSLSVHVDSRFSYLNLGEANHSILLSSAFEPRLARRRTALTGLSQDESQRKALAKLDTAIRDSYGAEISMVAAESISSFGVAGLESFREFFRTRGFLLDVFLLVREPLEWTKSMISERVKHGLDNPFQVPEVHPRYSRLKGVFRDRLRVATYEELISERGDLVSGFCDLASIPGNPESIGVSNPGLNRTVFDIWNTFNESGFPRPASQKSERARWRTLRLLEELFLDEPPLPSHLFSNYVNYNDFESLYKSEPNLRKFHQDSQRPVPLCDDDCSYDDRTKVVTQVLRDHLQRSGHTVLPSATLVELLGETFYVFLMDDRPEGEKMSLFAFLATVKNVFFRRPSTRLPTLVKSLFFK